MSTQDYPYGIGIYTVPDAALLTGVAGKRLRRWMHRYTYTAGAAETQAPGGALWQREINFDEQELLSFRDLIEAKWVNFFRDQNVSWGEIKDVAAREAAQLKVTHPFSTGQFAAVVKGRRARPAALIAEIKAGKMREVLSDQYTLDRVMAPFVRQLEYKGNMLSRWFPLVGSRRVLLDPAVRFGAPVVTSGVPTELLWRNHRNGGATYRAIARWWDIPEAEVRDAVKWEDRLRAA